MLYRKREQSGLALIYALFMVLIFSILISVLVKDLINSIRNSTNEFRKAGQASSVAKAGLEQAYFWFVKQNADTVTNDSQRGLYDGTKNLYIQDTPNSTGAYQQGALALETFFKYPDSGFFPNYNKDPNKRDTDDERIGLVQDIEIDKTNKLFGNYVVKRQMHNNDPNIGGSYSNNIADAVHDISTIKSISGADPSVYKGRIWKLSSTGYLYIRNNFDRLEDGSYACTYDNKRRSIDYTTNILTYTTDPDPSCNNTYVNEAKASVDLQRISVNSNSFGGVLINKGQNVNVNANTLITGGAGPGVLYKTGTPSLSSYVKGTGDVAGSGFKKNALLDISTLGLLSVDETTLKGLADQNIDSVAQLKTDARKSLGSYKIICISPKNVYTLNDSTYEVTFNAANPLRGSGIVYIDGDVNITNDSNSLFSGILYIKGSLRIDVDNSITGSVVLESPNSTLTLVGNSGSTSIEYSSKIMENISKRMAKYRKNSLTYKFYDSNK